MIKRFHVNLVQDVTYSMREIPVPEINHVPRTNTHVKNKRGSGAGLIMKFSNLIYVYLHFNAVVRARNAEMKLDAGFNRKTRGVRVQFHLCTSTSDRRCQFVGTLILSILSP